MSRWFDVEIGAQPLWCLPNKESLRSDLDFEKERKKKERKINARGAFLGRYAKFVLNTAMNFIKISLSKRDEIYFCCCQEFYLGNTFYY